MKLGNPVEIADGIHQIRAVASRVTVISHDGNPTLLIDSGARGSLPLISSGLKAIGMNVRQIDLVVLTHYHPDHSGGLSKLVSESLAKVAVHRLEAGIIKGVEPPPNPFGQVPLAGLVGPFMKFVYGGPVDVDYELQDKDQLDVDEEINVVHVPGHTMGSICLHMPMRGIMIVGDALQNRLWKLGPPAKSVTRNPDMAIRSLEKLLSMDFDTMVFSHFPAIKRGARRALKKMLENN